MLRERNNVKNLADGLDSGKRILTRMQNVMCERSLKGKV